MKPVRLRLSEVHEIMQITVSRGEWVQVALAMHKYGEEPRYEIVQLAVNDEGVPEVHGDLTPIRWGHDAEVADDDDATIPVRAKEGR